MKNMCYLKGMYRNKIENIFLAAGGYKFNYRSFLREASSIISGDEILKNIWGCKFNIG